MINLNNLTVKIRESIVSMLLEAKSGHIAGALGMADVFVALYFSVLKHNPKNPTWQERDRVILSNGHICPVLYATLAEAGYFPKSELKTLRKFGSRLQGHPHNDATQNRIRHNSSNKLLNHSYLKSLPGIENTSGPLGQGLSQAIGIATAFKLDKQTNRVYCIMSDGEQQEGQNWEAYMYAGNKNLDNLSILIDRNCIQIDGYTNDVMPLSPLKQKLESFNWNVIEIDGHNIKTIINACNQAKSTQKKPTAIICNTIPGKGVDFMENLPKWHGMVPNIKQAKKAYSELEKQKI